MEKMHYHMVGIGGTGMSGLARILKAEGNVVTGSEITLTEITRALEGEGIPVACPQTGRNIPKKCDMGGCSAAVPKTNLEYKAAKRRRIAIRKYPEVVGEVMSGKSGIAFCGTHGKTSSAALASHTFAISGCDPTFLVGGDLVAYETNSRVGSGRHFIVEACEYQRSFLNLSPEAVVITNVEADHLDYYRNLDDIIAAFGAFAGKVPKKGLLVVNAADANAKEAIKGARAEVQTIGLCAKADWNARIVTSSPGRTRFEIRYRGRGLGVADLGLIGEHNVLNALGVAAVAHWAGLRSAEILHGMSTFRGVKRRFEVISGSLPVTVIDDYAHHPTEISKAIAAARLMFPDKEIWALFQPHQYSRTRFFLDEFAEVLAAADYVVIPNIYDVRDPASERKKVGPRDLVERIRKCGGRAEYTAGFAAALNLLEDELTPECALITMGAGDVNAVAYEYCRRLAG